LMRTDPDYMDISLIRDSSKLPDVIGGFGFNEFLNRQFIERHVLTGGFDKVGFPYPISQPFRGMDLTDRTGSYHIFGGSAFTMLVDRRKLGSRPIPRTWADVLDPCFRNMVVIGFNIDDINEIPLLYTYKEFGERGLQALADNLVAPIDTLDMMRTSLRQDNANAIYLVPHFFACAAPQEDYLEEVWPEDGAMLSPYYLLARNTEQESTKAILSFLQGVEFAQVLSGRKMVHVRFEIEQPFNGRPLKWIGWDWLMNHPIVETMATIDSIVVPRVLEKRPELLRGIGRALWNG
jgi:ABC-type Fe3+ transport system substrate-binding protein